MVGKDDIRTYLKAQPFRPFQIRMTSGRTFDIRHPEMSKIGKNTLVVFFYVSDEPDIHDSWDTISMMSIENVTHLETQAA